MNSGIQSPKEIHPIVSEVHVDAMNIKSIFSNQDITIRVDHEVSNDEALLLAMGMKQEFKREMSGFAVLQWGSLFWVYFHLLLLVLIINNLLSVCLHYLGLSPWFSLLVLLCPWQK